MKNKTRAAERKARRQAARKSEELHIEFAASSLDIQAADDSGGPPRVDIKAYNGGLLRLSNFRYPTVIDTSSVTLHGNAEQQPLLRDHTTSRPIGHGKPIIATESLSVEGRLSIPGGDRDEIVQASNDGFQWQASVGGSIRNRRKNLETYGAGKRVRVNGRDFDGPVHVVRAFNWKETSLTALGADEDRAAAQVAASDKGKPMSKFEKWLEGCGVAAADLDENQETDLRAAYDAMEQVAASKPSDDSNPPVDVENLTASLKSSLTEELRAEQARAARLERIFASNSDSPLPTKDIDELRAKAESGELSEEGLQLAFLRASRQDNTSNSLGGRAVANEEAVIEAALARSIGIEEEEIAASLNMAQSQVERVMNDSLQGQYREASIHTIIHAINAQIGNQIVGKVTDEHIHAALKYSRDDTDFIQASSGTGFSSISLPGILSRLANKAMLRAYAEADNGGVMTRIASETSTNDFKKFNRYRLTEAGIVEEVPASGEIEHGELIEEEYENQVKQYGKLLTLTRVMMKNDDLNAFLQIPRLMGRQARHGLEQRGITTLVDAPTNAGAGTTEFFHGAVRGNQQPNYFEGATSNLSMDSLETAYQLFLDQVDADGKPIMIDPAILLVCTGDYVMARKLYRDTEYRFTIDATKETINNQWQGMFAPEKSSYMGRLGATPNPDQWYLLPDPTLDVSAIQIAYLDGVRNPQIRQAEMDLKVLGVVYRVVFDFGIALQDPRAAVKSKGKA